MKQLESNLHDICLLIKKLELERDQSDSSHTRYQNQEKINSLVDVRDSIQERLKELK